MEANAFFIEKYRDEDAIIKTYYRADDGKLVQKVVNPLKIDNRQMCSFPENQGDTPHCAGFSCGNMWEALCWKRTGKLINLESSQIYARAKEIDGDRNSFGTNLQAAQEACAELCGVKGKVKLGYIVNDHTENTIIRMKFYLHKYDLLHIGCAITTNWYPLNEKNYIVQPGGIPQGGHAIIACGYDNDGLYIQNSWGMGWGAKSFAIVPWNVFMEHFLYACYIENYYELDFGSV